MPPQVARAGGSGYTTYGDPRLGYTLDRPTRWTVHADSHTILVQSPDRAQTALIETFDAPAGESAEERLQQATAKETALFPEATLNLLPGADGETQAVGALAFSGPASARSPFRGRRRVASCAGSSARKGCSSPSPPRRTASLRRSRS